MLLEEFAQGADDAITFVVVAHAEGNGFQHTLRVTNGLVLLLRQRLVRAVTHVENGIQHQPDARSPYPENRIEPSVVQVEGFLRLLLDFPGGKKQPAGKGNGKGSHETGEPVLAQSAPSEEQDDERTGSQHGSGFSGHLFESAIQFTPVEVVVKGFHDGVIMADEEKGGLGFGT